MHTELGVTRLELRNEARNSVACLNGGKCSVTSSVPGTAPLNHRFCFWGRHDLALQMIIRTSCLLTVHKITTKKHNVDSFFTGAFFFEACAATRPWPRPWQGHGWAVAGHGPGMARPWPSHGFAVAWPCLSLGPIFWSVLFFLCNPLYCLSHEFHPQVFVL